MSEKLNYQLVGAKEIFHDGELIPERALIFEGPNLHEEVSFPKYGTTLIFDGEIYDWFGRKVIKSKSIVEIIHYLGTFSCSDYNEDAFIVRDTRRRLSIAWVEHYLDWDQIDEEVNKLPDYSQICRAAYNINHDYLCEFFCVVGHLHFYNFIPPTSASRPPILNIMDPQKEILVIPECWMEGARRKTYPYFYSCTAGAGLDNSLYDVNHKIYATRNAALKGGKALLENPHFEPDIDISPDEPLNKYTDLERYSTDMEAKIKRAEYEIIRSIRKEEESKIRPTSKLSFSKNGEKMYTKFTCGRCITDMEVMQKASSKNTESKKHIYWYLA